MEKDIKVIIIGDVHGRDFWRKAVMENLDKEIIFLGDYLDPYTGDEGITQERAIEVFQEIVELARNHKNIHLLLGNHDAGYCLGWRICEVRHDWQNDRLINKIFSDNFDLFNIAREKVVNKKHFLFSHAGVNPSWLKYNSFIFREGFRPTANNFNKLLHSEDAREIRSYMHALGDVSYYRGGYESYGSIIWADIREFLNNKELKKWKTIQVVGHTRLKGVALKLHNNFYCVDCQRVCYMDGKGIIRYYDTNEEILDYHDAI